MLIAEKQPVSSTRTSSIPVCKKRTKRRDPCARANHNDILLISRQTELRVFMNVKFNLSINRELRQKIRTQSKLYLIIHIEFVSCYCDVYFTTMRFRRRGNGIQSWCDGFQQTNELFKLF